jgi:hypothetical protein
VNIVVGFCVIGRTFVHLSNPIGDQNSVDQLCCDKELKYRFIDLIADLAYEEVS